MSALSFGLIGEGSLCLQCAKVLQDRGHSIALLVTENPEARQWAEQEAISVHTLSEVLSGAVTFETVDWLFSITNMTPLPRAVFAACRKGAINLHGGPLPRYAGLNAPSWAIQNGETRFGITWHLLEDAIDAGDMLDQTLFEISPDETALTLTTKCYAVALDTFPALVGMLESGALQRTPQNLAERTLYKGLDRPEADGHLDISRDAADLAALVRSLDHGSIWNPLTTPKVRIGGASYAVGAARVKPDDAAAPPANASAHPEAPGTVIASGADSLTIVTGGGLLVLEGLTDLGGAPVAPHDLISSGDALPVVTEAERQALAADAARAARHDTAWRARLQDLAPTVLPQATASTGPARWARSAIAWPSGFMLDQCSVAIGLWAARLCAAPHVDLAWHHAGTVSETGLLSDWVPLGIDAAPEASVAEVARALEAALDSAQSDAGFARDIVLRDPDMDTLAVPDIALVTAGTDPVEAACISVILSAEGPAELVYDAGRLDAADIPWLTGSLEAVAAAMAATPDGSLLTGQLPLLGDAGRRTVLEEWNATTAAYDRDACLHTLIADQAARTPDATALVFEDQSLSYAALEARINRVAHVLRGMGVGPDALVGLFMPRTLDLVIGALGILKTGGAYVPLDPSYPMDRLAFYIEDSAAGVILTHSSIAGELPVPQAGAQPAVLEIDRDPRLSAAPETPPETAVSGHNLAYVIYTSGSTGKPKGVMVEHRNVVNFCVGMDARIPHDPPGTWLAMTSLSFDISVLELFWTLARGFKVILTGDINRTPVSGQSSLPGRRQTDFSLYYWGADGAKGASTYDLLLEGARFADKNGFAALWTPERHFHDFGGAYPNPAVTGAAVAAITENLSVRAGSCVGPLHHPIRIAEEWAVIDNLTGGRSGMAIASGWQPDDFVLRPENTPPKNRKALFETIETVRKLWRGEAVGFPTQSGDLLEVVTQPRPLSPEANLWVTTAGNPETWRDAGKVGANVLTHLLGQSIDEVGDKIALYRQTLATAGHDPDAFKVTLLLHTLIGPDRDAIREAARGPMQDYLRSAAGLMKHYAWSFFAFKDPERAKTAPQMDLRDLPAEDMDAILDFAFTRYFDQSGLFGTVEDGLARVEEARGIGVDEVACLIDYGVPQDQVRDGLVHLAELIAATHRQEMPQQDAPETVLEATSGAVSQAAPASFDADDFSLATQILRHRVTHLQCTPSMAQMLVSDTKARAALARVSHVLVGGEALPGSLATEIHRITGTPVENMYGPTEATIWSTTGPADGADATAPIGTPIANTQIYVLDAHDQLLPAGQVGTLWIGGDGVTRGYLGRENLTASVFRANPFRPGETHARMYCTGDLASWRPDGTLTFLGRADHQVKIRGYRIELGEIESRLVQAHSIREAVVIARQDMPGDQRLVAYLISDADLDPEGLRAHLSESLPDYMLPSHFVRLDHLPLTPNKKVDRKALPAPKQGDSRPTTGADFVAPDTNVETTIAKIWQKALGVAQVGTRDNFFLLGGHSLLAIQVHRDLRATLKNERLSITDIFRFPVLADLARHLDTQGGAGGQTDPGPEPEADALTRSETMSRRRAMRANRPRASI